jgi:hypothetical protein
VPLLVTTASQAFTIGLQIAQVWTGNTANPTGSVSTLCTYNPLGTATIAPQGAAAEADIVILPYQFANTNSTATTNEFVYAVYQSANPYLGGNGTNTFCVPSNTLPLDTIAGVSIEVPIA